MILLRKKNGRTTIADRDSGLLRPPFPHAREILDEGRASSAWEAMQPSMVKGVQSTGKFGALIEKWSREGSDRSRADPDTHP